MKVQLKQIDKYSTEIYINGESQGIVVKDTSGFWYSIKGKDFRSRGEAIDFIIDAWDRRFNNGNHI